jgi:hypothetical protein
LGDAPKKSAGGRKLPRWLVAMAVVTSLIAEVIALALRLLHCILFSVVILPPFNVLHDPNNLFILFNVNMMQVKNSSAHIPPDTQSG